MKLFLLVLISTSIFYTSSGQVLMQFTSPSTIASQIPGYSEITTINTKTYSYTPSIPSSSPTPIDDDSTTEDDKLYRYADMLSVSIGMSDGNITTTSAGKVWTLRISIPNAVNIGLTLNQFNLSSSAQMFVFNEDRSILFGAIQKQNFTNSDVVGITSIKGNSIIVYIVEPNNYNDLQSTIAIQEIAEGFRDLDEVQDVGNSSQRASVNCDPLILCSPEKLPSARSVARFFSNGYAGTGTLLNNELYDGKAYFLTAFHVLDVGRPGIPGWPNGIIDADEVAALSGSIFHFQYWRSSCNGTVNNFGIFFSGAILRAASKSSDMVLLELINPPGVGDGVNYAGWNRQTDAPNGSASFIIHHPQTLDMRLTTTSNVRTWLYNSAFWTAHYSSGTTDKGSSGAALFNENNQVVGQLRSGWSNCNFTDFGDRYGKFNYSWDGGSLQQWLSPTQGLQSTGALILSPFEIIGNDNIACSSQAQQYSVPNLINATYFWQVSSNFQIVSGQGTSTINITTTGGNSGSVSVTISTPKGLTRSLTVTKQVLNDVPAVNFSLQPFYPNQQFCTNSFGNTIDIEPQNIPGISGFQWGYSSYQNGIPPTVIQNNGGYDQDFIFSVGGNYQIFASPQNACGTGQIETLNIFVDDNCSGGGFNSFAIAPNPTNGDLQVSSNDKKTKIKEIRVTDKKGSIKKDIIISSNSTSVKIDVSSLPADVYYIQIFDGKKWTSKPISKK